MILSLTAEDKRFDMSAAGFTESTFQRKLRDLNASAQCIQQLSLWLIHHRKHCSAIVKTWYREFGKVPSASRKLAFLYLANDVVQNSKKKYPELFAKEYGGIMKKVLEQLAVMVCIYISRHDFSQYILYMSLIPIPLHPRRRSTVAPSRA